MTDIGGGWYIKKIPKGLSPLRIPKLSKNHKIRRMKFYKKMNIICIEWLEIRIILEKAWMGQSKKSNKEENLFQFFKK